MVNYKNSHNIEDLQDKINARSFEEPDLPRTELHKDKQQLFNEWQHPDLQGKIIQQQQNRSSSVFKKIFIGSIIFFVICSALALVIIFGGFNIISTSKVDVAFLGPVTIAAGEQLSVDVDVKNNNSAALEHVVMFVDYPDGTKDDQNSAQLSHQKIELGSLAVGQNYRQNLKAILFGNQKDIKQIKVSVQYNIKNSNDEFKKEKTYEVTLSSTPLVMTVAHAQQVTSGQEVTFDVDIVSNAAIELHNLLVRAQFPFGFEFKSSDPKPSIGQNPIWSIETLPPGQKKTIHITGILNGQENDERIFRFVVGEQSQTDPTAIATTYLSQAESVSVKRPALQADILLSDSASSTVVVEKNKLVNGSIAITNNLNVSISNIEINALFSGAAFDPGSPNPAGGGYYQSLNRTVIWNKQGDKKLALLAPGESEYLSFTFSPLPTASVGSTMSVKINVTGSAASSDGSLQKITNTQTRLVKLQSNVGMMARTFYSSGPFKNTGPIPPKVDQKTTYTVTWNVQNSSVIYNTIVKGRLPQGVEWLGATSPATEKISFDADTKQVTWNAGDVSTGANGARQVSFQVSIIPTVNQVGLEPTLVEAQTITAVDVFTGGNLSTTIEDLGTDLSADSTIKGSVGSVIK